jgi:nucleoside-diphosphate-sugar epimerase
MRTFVTGATGFIGTHVVRRLTEANHDVCCLVRETSTPVRLLDLGVEVVVGDVTDRDSVVCGMRGSDWVVNMAACTSNWQPDRQVYVDVNVEGTINVLEAALQTGVARVVNVCPAAVYGETNGGEFTEDGPQGTVRRGGHIATKCTADMLARDFCGRKGLPLAVVYPGCVIGPGDCRPTDSYRESIRAAEAATTRTTACSLSSM